MGEWRVIDGDCVEQMATLDEASVDAVVTDPPYGLSAEPDIAEVLRHWLAGDDYAHKSGGFMSKAWDSFVPGPAMWREVYRVLKPGAHLLAFFGTRTYDMGVIAIRMAGFQIRDEIAWLAGSGFPKSLDVSKAIDRRRDDADAVDTVRAWLDAQRIAAGVTLGQINEAMGLASNGGGLASTWTTNQTTRAVPQWEQWKRLSVLIGFGDEMDAEVWRLNGRKGQPGDAWNERPLLGRSDELLGRRSGIGNGASEHYTVGGTVAKAYDITAPATPEAERWQGWGTALKPAHEPIVVARKPLAGTVVANVLAHGTGALNIDGTRIGTGEDKGVWPVTERADERVAMAGPMRAAETDTTVGRWPANVVLDPEAAAMLDEQTGERKAGGNISGDEPSRVSADGTTAFGVIGRVSWNGHGDSGGASRFFYCAKSSSAERNAGLDGFEDSTPWRTTGQGLGLVKEPGASLASTDRPTERRPTKNGHPTVKPIALMRWLVRLVTPPGGTVLDPFAGSGTTGCAAMLEGFRFVGIEREPEYAAIARARIAWWAEHPEGMELVARLEAEKQRKAVAESGQLGLFDG